MVCSSGEMWRVWLWRVVGIICCSMAASMQPCSPLPSDCSWALVRGRGGLALVPTWLGGSSGR
eukprot:scaffold61367_cov43-Tisochrysis_lutea.AAC.1